VESVSITRAAVAFLTVAVMVLFISSGLSAHGVTWDYSKKKSYGLEFSYDDDTPMKYVEIKVFGPDDKEKLSQTGRTDQNGYFAFIPSADGLWVVTANDNNGHLAQADLTIKSDVNSGVPQAGAPEPTQEINLDKVINQATKPYKIALVICFFLLLGLVAKVYGRKKSPAKAVGPESAS
jgi:hypothetical protein